MGIVDLASQAEGVREQAAALLCEHIDEPRGWPTYPFLSFGRQRRR